MGVVFHKNQDLHGGCFLQIRKRLVNLNRHHTIQAKLNVTIYIYILGGSCMLHCKPLVVD